MVPGHRIKWESLDDQTNFCELDSRKFGCSVPAVVLKELDKKATYGSDVAFEFLTYASTLRT